LPEYGGVAEIAESLCQTVAKLPVLTICPKQVLHGRE
jgi:hypothetical protein